MYNPKADELIFVCTDSNKLLIYYKLKINKINEKKPMDLEKYPNAGSESLIGQSSQSHTDIK